MDSSRCHESKTRPYVSKPRSRWLRYLTMYFGQVDLSQLKLLEPYQLRWNSRFSNEALVQVQNTRTPALFVLDNSKFHWPSNVTDFLRNSIGVDMDINVGFFDDQEPSRSLREILRDNTPVSTLTNSSGKRLPSLILRQKSRSVVEDLPIGSHSACLPLLEHINQYNRLWQTPVGKIHCGINGVLSEPRARSISHFHHLPFWNFAYQGTKLYMLYDINAAIRLNFVRVKSDQTMSSSPLQFSQFLILARSGQAWLAELRAGQILLVPEKIAHDVFTVDEGELYMGLQGNWLAEAESSRRILEKSTYPSNGHMQFQATKRDVERMLENTVYSDSSNDEDTPEYYTRY